MEEEKKTTPLGCILMLAYIPFGVVLSGLMVRSLWLWFVTPFGLPRITLMHAAALNLLFHAVTFHDAKQEDRTATARIIFHVLLCLWLWGWGWLFHRAMVAGY